MSSVAGALERASSAGIPKVERVVALIVAGLGVVLAIGLIPWSTFRAGSVPALAPSLITGGIIAMVVTAVVLRTQYQATNFPPYAFLGTTYLCTAGLMVPYALVLLTVPHNAAAAERITQMAGWLWVGFHSIFILTTGFYLWSDSFFNRKAFPTEVERDIVRGYVAFAALLSGAVGIAILAGAQTLPSLLVAAKLPILYMILNNAMLASCVAATIGLILLTRLRQPAQLWLAIVLMLFVCEVFLDTTIVRRPFSLAWYAGLAEGFAWQMMLLFVLLRRANEQIETFARNNQSLIEETLRDALTGLHNRRGFDERLHAALAESRRSGGTVALLAMDLDHFKQYNDHFGHLAGDEALRAISRALRTVVTRSRDVACRIGGEEFAIVLPFTDEAGAMTIAERVRAAVLHMRLPHAPSSPFGMVTISVGVAVGSGTSNSNSLYEAADQALYRAKRMGRNRIARFAPGPEEVTPATLRVV